MLCSICLLCFVPLCPLLFYALFCLLALFCSTLPSSVLCSVLFASLVVYVHSPIAVFSQHRRDYENIVFQRPQLSIQCTPEEQVFTLASTAYKNTRFQVLPRVAACSHSPLRAHKNTRFQVLPRVAACGEEGRQSARRWLRDWRPYAQHCKVHTRACDWHHAQRVPGDSLVDRLPYIRLFICSSGCELEKLN